MAILSDRYRFSVCQRRIRGIKSINQKVRQAEDGCRLSVRVRIDATGPHFGEILKERILIDVNFPDRRPR